MNTADQLKFIVNFANVDLDYLREGDAINLQEDFRVYFPVVATHSPGHVLFDARGDPEYEKYPKLKFLPLQSEVRAILRTKSRPKGITAITTPIEIKVSYLYMTGDFLLARGKFRDLFLQSLINLLLDEEASSRIRQCPQCAAFFIRVRRQLFCSSRCVDAANKKAWLQTEKGKKYLRGLKKKRSKRKTRLTQGGGS